MTQFETWLGRPVDGVLGFLNHSSWEAFTSSASWAATQLWPQVDRHVYWSVPLIVQGATLEQAASGAYNDYYKQAAQALAASRPQDDQIHVRTGWEFNGNGFFPWSAQGHEQAYIGAFRQFVDTFRSVSDKFLFEWNVNESDGHGALSMDPATAYPGDAYVDIIGMDSYYHPQWDGADPVAAWEGMVNDKYGLQWHQDFAAAHGKPTAYSEWGVTGDNAGPLIERAKAWFESHNVVYHTYWNSDSSYAGKLSDNSDPNSGNAYIQAFSRENTAGPGPGVIPPPLIGGDDHPGGGAGVDILVGGFGNDTFLVDNAADVIVEASNSGYDTVLATVSYALNRNAPIEVLRTENETGTLPINLTGSNAANSVLGNAGTNALRGLGGDDVINGRAGSDKLFGGSGRDKLTGGAGRDLFVFDSNPPNSRNYDRITDFRSIDDTIQLDNAVFTKIGRAGKLAAATLHLGTKAVDVSDRLIYDRTSGSLYYDADGTGRVAQVKIAVLTNKASVNLSDFFVI